MEVFRKILTYFGLYLWLTASIGLVAFAQTSSDQFAVQTELERKLQRLLDLVGFAGEGQLGRQAWPEKPISEVYAPTVCTPDIADFKPRFPNQTPILNLLIDGRRIAVGSAEFQAMSIIVDPLEDLEFSCPDEICRGLLPARVLEENTVELSDVLRSHGFIHTPMFQEDGCGLKQDWCTFDTFCQSRSAFYYREEDRMQLRVSPVKAGRRRGSKQLQLTRDADPICDFFMIRVLEKMGVYHEGMQLCETSD